ncbi:hypothetical protein GUY44_18865 [Pimelobacter simplex]|uniref:Phage tail length tape-measure protein n=1 Tax=Nocardioides simplex TaxID=2045 RepID=A0A0A1DN47_NOCSI|nr:hypothetical protein [Pimelobacter simplex]AIY18007.2 Phage tail length tape-measure protein [Pimelobacter simplex]MCG8152555.1 hypothetical protein [Pimelobacter simplex]GEB17244.1 hypothetical protein NSI01_55590 [Pimelobacter simplex]SFM77078.1 hypothetical protein SAMN05421671_3444 [Pimelobacter simplex]
MSVRLESVRVSAEDAGFSTSMAKMTAAAAMFGATLDHVDGAGVRVKKTLPTVSDGIDDIGRSSRKAGPEIDRLSGRVRIFADLMAVLGPSAIPIAGTAVPAVTGLASQLGFAAIGAISLVAASQGVGDALKAANKAAIEPTAENLQKAREEMERLGPDARKFVREFDKIRPTLTYIRDASAAGWFPGLTEALKDFDRLGPRFADISELIGRRGGDLIAEGADALAGPEWDEFWSFVEQEAPGAVEDLLRTVGNLSKGLAELWMAFQPTNNQFGDWLLEQSRDFAKWSEELKDSDGFQEFIDYIETNGPRVAAAAGAIGDAILQIIEALAPLGGPSLKIIEIFGDAVSAIADSDLGTPILAGVAALALYSRGLQAAAALQTKLYGGAASARLAERGVFGFTRGLGKDLKSATPSMKEWGTVAYRMGQSSKYASEQTLAARKSVRSFSSQAAKGAAPVAGLAVAASGAADGIGLTNTASLALAGSFAGPWGAAMGGGIGLMMDFASASGEATKGIEGMQAAIDSMDPEAIRGQLDAFVADNQKYLDDWTFGDTLSAGWKDLISGGQFSKTVELAGALPGALSAAEAQQQEFNDAMRQGGLIAAESAYGLQRLIGALNEQQATSRGAIDAQYAWGAAVMQAREQMKNGKDGFDEFTEAGQQNMTIAREMADVWNRDMEAAQASGLTYDKVRSQIERFAMAQGKTREEAEDLARELVAFPEEVSTRLAFEYDRENLEDAKAAFDSLPKDVRTDIKANGIPQTESAVDALVRKYKLTEKERKALVKLMDQATPSINAIIARLNDIRDRNVTVTTTFRNFYENVPKPGKPGKKPKPSIPPAVPGFDAQGSADGSTVPDDGRGYRDYMLYRLAPREEVISNRSGQADEFRPELKDINRGMSRREVAERMMTRGLAGGGTAGRNPSWSSALGPVGQSGGGKNPTWLPDGMKAIELIQYELPKSLKGLNRALKRSQKAVDDETEARDRVIAKMDSIRGAASDRVRSGLFPNNDVWSAGGSFDDVMAVLNGDNLNGAQLVKDIEALRSKGVNEGALEALLREAPDAQSLTDFANRSAADLAKYVSALNLREQYATKAGDAAAATYAKELAAQVRELRQANGRLDAIEKAIKAEHKEDRQSRNRGNSKGHRGRNGK